MSRSLFVVPEVIKLPLFDDGQYWIEVKVQLNAGETRQLAFGAFSRVNNTGTLETPSIAFDLNLEAGTFNKILVYLIDWNLTDAAGKTVVIDTPKAKRDALRALHPDVFTEIERVIDVHAAAPQEKKAPNGMPTPKTTS